jgi:site-specific DNA recombinase
MNCAIYARYSNEKQSPTSIADQIRKCREYAGKNGWQVLDSHIYSDEAVSGATDDRVGLKGLLGNATSQARGFDCVLVDDTSRLSRDLLDSLGIKRRLQFADVRIVFVSQGIDSLSEQSDILTAVHGVVDELYIKELAKKTFRGVEGLARRGLHTGGRCFGYRNVPIEDDSRRDPYGKPKIIGVRLEAESQQAEVVRQIFTMYASGRSLRFISKQLNAHGIQSPQPQKGRISRSWCPSSIRGILRNERYRGVVLWGKKRKVRSPKTGRRVYKPRPVADWVRTEIPEQRIVSDELWERARARRETVNRLYTYANQKSGLLNSRLVNSPYLFSGLLKCSECGANMTILWGKGRNKSTQTYGCPQNWSRGSTVCSNTVRIRRDDLEAKLLAGLQREVLREEVIDYVMDQFEAEMKKALQLKADNMDATRRRKAELEAKITNLVSVLATGINSVAIIDQLTKMEREVAHITESIVSLEPNFLPSRINQMRDRAKVRLNDVRGLLNCDAASCCDLPENTL